jgi:hypothetical protein
MARGAQTPHLVWDRTPGHTRVCCTCIACGLVPQKHSGIPDASARRRAHHAVDGRTIPAPTPAARRTSSERGAHGVITARHQRAGRPVDRSCHPCQRRTPQGPAEPGTRPGGAPGGSGCPAHAPGTSTTRVPLLARAALPCGAPSPSKRLPHITIRGMDQPHVCS